MDHFPPIIVRLKAEPPLDSPTMVDDREFVDMTRKEMLDALAKIKTDFAARMRAEGITKVLLDDPEKFTTLKLYENDKPEPDLLKSILRKQTSCYAPLIVARTSCFDRSHIADDCIRALRDVGDGVINIQYFLFIEVRSRVITILDLSDWSNRHRQKFSIESRAIKLKKTTV